MNKDEMKLTPLSELVDEAWPPVGTPERDAMEKQLNEEVQASKVGKAINKACIEQHLTPEE